MFSVQPIVLLKGLFVFVISYFILNTHKTTINIPCFLTCIFCTIIYLYYIHQRETYLVKKEEDTTPKTIKELVKNKKTRQILSSLSPLLKQYNEPLFYELIHLCTLMENTVQNIPNEKNSLNSNIELLHILQQDIQNCLGSFIHSVPKLSPETWKSFIDNVNELENMYSQQLHIATSKIKKIRNITYNSYPKPNPGNCAEYSVHYSVFV